MSELSEFLLTQIAADEAAARVCAEMFPSPWEIADRGWRVRIYAGDVPIEDLSSDDPEAMTTRNPVVMEVEPDRHIDDPRWLSERVEHVRRQEPAHVLAVCEAHRRIVEDWQRSEESIRARRTPTTDAIDGHALALRNVVRALAAIYADHPDFDPAWRLT